MKNVSMADFAITWKDKIHGFFSKQFYYILHPKKDKKCEFP